MAKLSWSWTKIEAAPDPKHGSPCARSSHGVSIVKSDTLFVYGGENIARTPIDKSSACWACCNLSTAPAWQWIDCSKGPPDRIAHSQAVYDDRYVYVFGGRAGIHMDEKAMQDLWVFDTNTYTWSEVIPQKGGDPPPEARSFHRMICIGSDLYVFGGCGAEHGRLSDLHKFDILKTTWHNLGASKLLRGRGGPNLIPIQSGNKIAVVAGFAGEETNDGHIFDLESESWQAEALTSKLEGLRPRSVCVSASFPLCGVSVIFGGEVDPSDRGHEGAGGFENDVVVLDEKTGAYKETIKEGKDVPWPEQRGWSDSAAIDGPSGQLYVFGGLSGNDANPRRLDDLWKLTIQ